MSQEALLQNLRETRARLAGQLDQARAAPTISSGQPSPEQAETMARQFEATILDLDRAIALLESLNSLPLNMSGKDEAKRARWRA
jgi:hypothetical protein